MVLGPRPAREFARGFGRGLRAGGQTAFNLANTASGGTLHAAIAQAQQTARDVSGRDFKPIADALRKS